MNVASRTAPSIHNARVLDGATALVTAPAASDARAPSARRAAIIACVKVIRGSAAA
jgi:hypothetical protein